MKSTLQHIVSMYFSHEMKVVHEILILILESVDVLICEWTYLWMDLTVQCVDHRVTFLCLWYYSCSHTLSPVAV